MVSLGNRPTQRCCACAVCYLSESAKERNSLSYPLALRKWPPKGVGWEGERRMREERRGEEKRKKKQREKRKEGEDEGRKEGEEREAGRKERGMKKDRELLIWSLYL